MRLHPGDIEEAANMLSIARGKVGVYNAWIVR
jgi:hypothetical protein